MKFPLTCYRGVILFRTITILLFTWCVVSLFSPPIFSTEQYRVDNQADNVLTRIQSRYGNLKSLSCKFQGESRNVLTGVSDKMSGVLWVVFPEKMRWDYKQPRQTVLYDGNRLIIHFADDNQIFVSPGDSVTGVYIAFIFFTDTSELKRQFNIELLDAIKTRDTNRIALRLTPRRQGTGISSIVITWNNRDQWITKLSILDTYNNNVIYMFQDFQENPRIKKKMFKFKIPRDAEVFDLDGNRLDKH